MNMQRKRDNGPDIAADQPNHQVTILAQSPTVLDRLIATNGGKGYGATWVYVRKTVSERQREDGTIEVLDPPVVETHLELVVVDSNGTIYTDSPIPESKPLSALPMLVRLHEVPDAKLLWSGDGLRRYIAGDRPDPIKVFRALVAIIDHFMDFHGSFADQGTMCDLIACWVLHTYFLDAFSVTGYIWPNGESGSGKTHLLEVVAVLSYLGTLILMGSSFASLRDLASYGAALLFDDAENLMDGTGDPDKQSLLLAGNRKGAVVTIKVPAGKGIWKNRRINAFCPRGFSAIQVPIDTMLSRTILIPLLASDNPRKANSDPLDTDAWPTDISRRALVDDLWALGISHVFEMPDFDRRAALESGISGRTLQRWRALLAVALWLDERGVNGLHARITAAVDRYRQEAVASQQDERSVVLLALRRMITARAVDDPTRPVIFATSELRGFVNQVAADMDLKDDGDGKDFLGAKSLGWRLKRLRIRRPDARFATAKTWVITMPELQRLERANGILSPDASDDDTPSVTTA